MEITILLFIVNPNLKNFSNVKFFAVMWPVVIGLGEDWNWMKNASFNYKVIPLS